MDISDVSMIPKTLKITAIFRIRNLPNEQVSHHDASIKPEEVHIQSLMKKHCRQAAGCPIQQRAGITICTA